MEKNKKYKWATVDIPFKITDPKIIKLFKQLIKRQKKIQDKLNKEMWKMAFEKGFKQ